MLCNLNGIHCGVLDVACDRNLFGKHNNSSKRSIVDSIATSNLQNDLRKKKSSWNDWLDILPKGEMKFIDSEVDFKSVFVPVKSNSVFDLRVVEHYITKKDNSDYCPNIDINDEDDEPFSFIEEMYREEAVLRVTADNDVFLNLQKKEQEKNDLLRNINNEHDEPFSFIEEMYREEAVLRVAADNDILLNLQKKEQEKNDLLRNKPFVGNGCITLQQGENHPYEVIDYLKKENEDNKWHYRELRQDRPYNNPQCYYKSLIPSRETHPFKTETGLVGGMPRRRAKQKKKRGPRSRKTNRGAVVIPKSMTNKICPESLSVVLSYVDDSSVRNSVGSNWLLYRYRANSAFDPDPLLATGALGGFLEWANFYRQYLVMSVTVEAEFSNLEAFPIALTWLFSDIDPGTVVISRTTAQNAAEQYKVTPVKVISAKGGQDRARFRVHYNLPRLTGSFIQYIANYFGLVNGNPGTICFLGVVAWPLDNSVFVNGVASMTRLNFKIKFTRRQTLFS
jgi:hypothetical protein